MCKFLKNFKTQDRKNISTNNRWKLGRSTFNFHLLILLTFLLPFEAVVGSQPQNLKSGELQSQLLFLEVMWPQANHLSTVKFHFLIHKTDPARLLLAIMGRNRRVFKSTLWTVQHYANVTFYNWHCSDL